MQIIEHSLYIDDASYQHEVGQGLVRDGIGWFDFELWWIFGVAEGIEFDSDPIINHFLTNITSSTH